MKPLAIDLFCGLGGWTEGLLAAGYHVIGFDIERHIYGDHKYPAQLVLQDVLTLHGSQFKNAALIVASPPCQEYSYMAMPWSRAKQIRKGLLGEGDFPKDFHGSRTVDALNRLYNACFRIQCEACEAGGRYIPMVVENVRGAQEWVGRAAWNYGSYYLWGDVPALMPIISPRTVLKQGITHRTNGETNFHGRKLDQNNSERMWKERPIKRLCDAYKTAGMNWSDQSKCGQDFTRIGGEQAGIKVPSEKGRRTNIGNGARFTSRECAIEGRKIGGDWFSDSQSTCRKHGSKSQARKMASAMIAKIPLTLSQHIASVYKPQHLGQQ